MIDRPIPPQQQCLTKIFKKIPEEQREKYRESIISANPQSLIAAGKKYLRS